MARAATGLTEVACWQFIGAGIGGVVALMFFLVMGAMNGMEPKPKPAEIVAPLRVPSKCTSWIDNEPAACVPPTNDCRPCADLKETIETKLTAKKAELLASPCDLDVDFELVSALGFYWQAKCREVYTGTGCVAKDGAERTDCEKDLAVKEASCAFLGLSSAPMSLAPNDADDRDTCLDYLSVANTVTQGQADRCATSPSMAWETLVFMTGGDMVNTQRCGAVTFAAVVAQGIDTPICPTSGAYNYNDGAATELVDTLSVCQDRRTCDNDVLRTLVSQTDQGLSEGAAGAMDTTWSTDSTTKVTTTTCVTGWEATAGTADYFCSHVPYTDSAGYPIDKTGGRLSDVSASIGTWVGGLECERRACPDQCGSALGDFITGDANSNEPRAPPEGLTDTCCSGVFGDECQIRCERGYEASDAPHVCMVPLDGGSQDTPVWGGASCTPMACLPHLIANAAGVDTARGSVGDIFTHVPCADGYFQAGRITCQNSLLFQGGGCTDRPAVAPIPALEPSSALASSNVGQAGLAFDNDPMTYWYSTERAYAQVEPVWVEVTLPSAVVPLGFSVQLGKSTDFNSYLIKPRNWKFQASNTGFDDGQYEDLYSVEGDAGGLVADSFNPPCNDKTIDPIGCSNDEDAVLPCPTDPDRAPCDSNSGVGCHYPSTHLCGPTEFPIRNMNTGEFSKFRMYIDREQDQFESDGVTLRTERYGTIYIQDIAVMTPATVYQTAGVPAVRYTFEPMETGCCGPEGECTSVDISSVFTFAECLQAVADAGAALLAGGADPNLITNYMQFSLENGNGVGRCYSVTPAQVTPGPKLVTTGSENGAMCWSVALG